ncbi:hypothetical protein [Mastigocoleus testarum]|uniref:Uncharacterized protein n=1 Tax=Mastigocoleus testarum BC008 TaxID=371196 RepID=A0A0V7ZPT5_9CYAN|nr:hypothetical protein [Mastigocoleus testarum]KST66388.1 hypothetical protein BC008_25800 [Mastigocoleus testarum BC008]KST66709.1 hypothetical protein BC008_26325 [Mastigocoleus testarum BC008]
MRLVITSVTSLQTTNVIVVALKQDLSGRTELITLCHFIRIRNDWVRKIKDWELESSKETA